MSNKRRLYKDSKVQLNINPHQIRASVANFGLLDYWINGLFIKRKFQ